MAGNTEVINKDTFKVNVAQLFTMVMQLLAIVWFAATLNTRVDNQGDAINALQESDKIQVAAQLQLTKDVTELKAAAEYQKDILDDIKDIVTRKPGKG